MVSNLNIMVLRPILTSKNYRVRDYIRGLLFEHKLLGYHKRSRCVVKGQ